jgi:hypothetical protein
LIVTLGDERATPDALRAVWSAVAVHEPVCSQANFSVVAFDANVGAPRMIG